MTDPEAGNGRSWRAARWVFDEIIALIPEAGIRLDADLDALRLSVRQRPAGHGDECPRSTGGYQGEDDAAA